MIAEANPSNAPAVSGFCERSAAQTPVRSKRITMLSWANETCMTSGPHTRSAASKRKSDREENGIRKPLQTMARLTANTPSETRFQTRTASW